MQSLDTYPLPRADDLFASLAGGRTFTTLDLAHAYQQIPLDEDSKTLVYINTHKGLCLQPSAFWSVICTLDFLVHHGEHSTGDQSSINVLGRHSDHEKVR